MKKASLFDEVNAQAAIEKHMLNWDLCWGWKGPREGGLCETNTCSPPAVFGRNGYAYTEQCRLLRELPDGRWVARIEMGVVHGSPWWKDGTLLLLSVTEIAPPTRMLRAARYAARAVEISRAVG